MNWTIWSKKTLYEASYSLVGVVIGALAQLQASGKLDPGPLIVVGLIAAALPSLANWLKHRAT